MEQKTSPDGFCRISKQHKGCAIYFNQELAKDIFKTMPISNRPGSPKYFVVVEPELIMVKVAKL